MELFASDRMTFRRYGRSYQLRIETPGDLAHIPHLDEALWMATSAPRNAFACDEALLTFLDTDHNSRIRSAEVRDGVTWLLGVLANHDRIGQQVEMLRLADINTEQAEGQQLRAAAQRILTNVGTPDATDITLAQVRDTKHILGAADTNGDGVIPPDAAPHPEIAGFIRDVMAAVGEEMDVSGKPGVTEDKLDQFLKEAQSYLAWHARGAVDGGPAQTPLGADTDAAYAALGAVRDKVDEFFRLCDTIAYEPESADAFRFDMPRPQGEESPVDFEERLAAAPLAALNPKGVLDLDGALSPAYQAALAALRARVLEPVFGIKVATLSHEQWLSACAAFDAHTQWQAEKPQTAVEPLGPEKLRHYLESRFRDAVQSLIEADRAVAQELDGVSQVEKLILYQRYLIEFTNNFVSFPHLYNPDTRALFECGTLIMDGRHFTLSLSVGKRADHVRIAANSKLFVLYLEIMQAEGESKGEVAVAVTSGDKGNLFVGKRGIFIDRDGRFVDARVTQIIENPISIREAITLPFRRIGQIIQSQIERFSGSGQKMLEQRVTKQVGSVTTTVQTAAQQQAAPAPKPAPKAGSSTQARDLLMGGSVAVAALGSAFAYIAKTLNDVELRTILMVVCLVLLAVIIPTVISAWAKLRSRDIGALLEASGWAINGRMRLTRRMYGIFTRRLPLPPNARKDRHDQLSLYKSYARRHFSRIREQITEIGRDISEAI